MSGPDTWRLRARTVRAMAVLGWARLVVAGVPLKIWRRRLGLSGSASASGLAEANREAAHIERAAWRLPLGAACLPRAVALSWRLRGARIPHRVVLAVRPPDRRDDEDALHAWVEVQNEIVLGELPGPWHVTARFPA